MKCTLKPKHIRFPFRTKPAHYKFNTMINKDNTLYARKHTPN